MTRLGSPVDSTTYDGVGVFQWSRSDLVRGPTTESDVVFAARHLQTPAVSSTARQSGSLPPAAVAYVTLLFAVSAADVASYYITT